MEDMNYKVYVLPDDTGRITAIASSAFLPDTDGWTLIDQGQGDRYHHAQGNYLEKPLMDERGILRYRLEDGKPVERTQAEMDADYVPPAPVPNDNLAAEVAEIKTALSALMGGIANA